MVLLQTPGPHRPPPPHIQLALLAWMPLKRMSLERIPLERVPLEWMMVQPVERPPGRCHSSRHLPTLMQIHRMIVVVDM